MSADEKRQDRGFTQLAATIAVLLSMASLLAVAFKLDNTNASNGSGTLAASTAPSESLKLVVKSDDEKGKKGSDGNWHDAYLPANFSVKPGASVTVTVSNYDDMPHSFTSPGLGVNAEIAAGSEDKPSKTTFVIHAPQKAGSYEWYCALPCDPWSMTHYGFMKGHVTVA